MKNGEIYKVKDERMKALIVGAVLILAYAIAFEAGKSSPRLGEFLGMKFGHSLLVLTIGAAVFIFYQGVQMLLAYAWNKDDAREESFSSAYSEDAADDLYLTVSSKTDSACSCRVFDKGKKELWRSRCILAGKNVEAIELREIASSGSILLRYDCGKGCYVVEDGAAILGIMGFRGNALLFRDGEKDVYTAEFVSEEDEGLGFVADWLLFFDLGGRVHTATEYSYFVLRDQEGKLLGKFYPSLKNVDFSVAEKWEFDRRILVLMSILLDCRKERFD